MLLKADRLFHTSYHSQAVHIRPICRVSHGEWGRVPSRGSEKTQAAPVGNGRSRDDFSGHWPRTKETEWWPGTHSRSLSWSLEVQNSYAVYLLAQPLTGWHDLE